jgi:hypothetical protein
VPNPKLFGGISISAGKIKSGSWQFLKILL